MQLYQMVEQEILLLLLQLKDLLVAVELVHLRIILVAEVEVLLNLVKLEFLVPHRTQQEEEEVQELRLVFQLLPQPTQAVQEVVDPVHQVPLLHVEQEEEELKNQLHRQLLWLVLLIEVVEAEEDNPCPSLELLVVQA